MTRSKLKGTLRGVYVIISLVIALSLLSRFADQVPGMPQLVLDLAARLYEVLRDMSLLIATLAAAYLANVFQKRSKFVASLEAEWRNIVRSKAMMVTYCQRPNPTIDDYLAVFCRHSETIDTMRTVFRNVGETKRLVGLYPFEPLHDMRRALQSIDPRRGEAVSEADRKLACEAIQQSFAALRETFLEELDLQAPTHAQLRPGAKRLKQRGAAFGARRQMSRLSKRQVANGSPTPVDEFLIRLYEAETGDVISPSGKASG